MKDFGDMVRTLKSSNNKNADELVKEMIGGASNVSKAQTQAETQAVKDALSHLNFKRLDEEDVRRMGLKKGGYVKKADGCAKRGKTKGRMV
jgi:hypothetical protein